MTRFTLNQTHKTKHFNPTGTVDARDYRSPNVALLQEVLFHNRIIAPIEYDHRMGDLEDWPSWCRHRPAPSQNAS